METLAVSTLVDRLLQTAHTAATRTALMDAETTVTFGELVERARRAAAALRDEGVAPGDRIAFVGLNRIEHLELTFGAAWLGAVTVPVNWRLTAAELAIVLSDMGARLVVADGGRAPLVHEIRDITGVQTLVVLDDSDVLRTQPWRSWIDHERVTEPAPQALDDVAVQIYTSGTTGTPKGVMLSNQCLVNGLRSTGAAWQLSPDSVMLPMLPFFHIAGLGAALGALMSGAGVVVTNDTDPSSIVETVSRHHVTNMVIPPVLLERVMDRASSSVQALSSLRVVSYGGSPITAHTLHEAVNTFGCDLVQVYGLSETFGLVTVLDPADHSAKDPQRLLSCGRPFEGVCLRVVDTDGADLPTGQIGEVWTRTPTTMLGYWGRPAETAAVLDAQGWLHTGDVGRLDAAGYLYLSDRLGDRIVSGGENLYPTEIENVLSWHPQVAEVAVVGAPHERWGETPIAVIVPIAEASVSEAELLTYVRERLAHFKCPTRVTFVDELPKNPSGKVLRRSLREPFWRGHTRRIH